ncbi:MAG: hypothetical protein AAFO91_20135 [Bacteroidota bacterium]
MSNTLQSLPAVVLLAQYRAAYMEPNYVVDGAEDPVPLFELLEYILLQITNNPGGDMPLATEGVQKTNRVERTDSLTLPSGGYYVTVKHIDPSGGTLLVNGEEVLFGGEYHTHVQYDRTENRQDFTEEIVISNPDEIEYALRVSYPQSHPFDPSTL